MFAPSVSTPGVYSPPTRRPITTSDVQSEVWTDSEVCDALFDLVTSLENKVVTAKAFKKFEERFFYLYLRARKRLEDQQDEHTDGGIGA